VSSSNVERGSEAAAEGGTGRRDSQRLERGGERGEGQRELVCQRRPWERHKGGRGGWEKGASHEGAQRVGGRVQRMDKEWVLKDTTR